MSMKIVVIGGTGLIGSKVVQELKAGGYDAVAASPDTGVNSVTGQGLAEVMKNASVVVDVSNSRSFDEKAATEFFQTSTRNLATQEKQAGVGHHVALSIVGTDRLQQIPYMRAKLAQETLIKQSGIPYSIVHATQFFEFWKAIADSSLTGGEIRVPDAFIQPIAAEEVAHAVAQVAMGKPLNGMVEVGGPRRMGFEEFIRQGLRAKNDSRKVVADKNAEYYGGKVQGLDLCAADSARKGEIRFEDWLSPAMAHSK